MFVVIIITIIIIIHSVCNLGYFTLQIKKIPRNSSTIKIVGRTTEEGNKRERGEEEEEEEQWR